MIKTLSQDYIYLILNSQPFPHSIFDMSNKFEEGSSTPKVDEDQVILAIKENISNDILPHQIWKMIKKMGITDSRKAMSMLCTCIENHKKEPLWNEITPKVHSYKPHPGKYCSFSKDGYCIYCGQCRPGKWQ